MAVSLWFIIHIQVKHTITSLCSLFSSAFLNVTSKASAIVSTIFWAWEGTVNTLRLLLIPCPTVQFKCRQQTAIYDWSCYFPMTWYTHSRSVCSSCVSVFHYSSTIVTFQLSTYVLFTGLKNMAEVALLLSINESKYLFVLRVKCTERDTGYLHCGKVGLCTRRVNEKHSSVVNIWDVSMHLQSHYIMYM